jgi:hypothetical protein
VFERQESWKNIVVGITPTNRYFEAKAQSKTEGCKRKENTIRCLGATYVLLKFHELDPSNIILATVQLILLEEKRQFSQTLGKFSGKKLQLQSFLYSVKFGCQILSEQA